MADDLRDAANLRALRQFEKSVVRILCTCSYCSVLKLDRQSETWKSMNCEGPLHVYERDIRDASPADKYGMTIMNTKSMDNVVQTLEAAMLLELKLENSCIFYAVNEEIYTIHCSIPEQLEKLFDVMQKCVADLRRIDPTYAAGEAMRPADLLNEAEEDDDDDEEDEAEEEVAQHRPPESTSVRPSHESARPPHESPPRAARVYRRVNPNELLASKDDDDDADLEEITAQITNLGMLDTPAHPRGRAHTDGADSYADADANAEVASDSNGAAERDNARGGRGGGGASAPARSLLHALAPNSEGSSGSQSSSRNKQGQSSTNAAGPATRDRKREHASNLFSADDLLSPASQARHTVSPPKSGLLQPELLLRPPDATLPQAVPDDREQSHLTARQRQLRSVRSRLSFSSALAPAASATTLATGTGTGAFLLPSSTSLGATSNSARSTSPSSTPVFGPITTTTAAAVASSRDRPTNSRDLHSTSASSFPSTRGTGSAIGSHHPLLSPSRKRKQHPEGVLARGAVESKTVLVPAQSAAVAGNSSSSTPNLQGQGSRSVDVSAAAAAHNRSLFVTAAATATNANSLLPLDSSLVAPVAAAAKSGGGSASRAPRSRAAGSIARERENLQQGGNRRNQHKSSSAAAARVPAASGDTSQLLTKAQLRTLLVNLALDDDFINEIHSDYTFKGQMVINDARHYSQFVANYLHKIRLQMKSE